MSKDIVITLGDTGGVSVSVGKDTYEGDDALRYLKELAVRVEKLMRFQNDIGKLQADRDNALLEIDASMTEKAKSG
jgi:hypothetical protein